MTGLMVFLYFIIGVFGVTVVSPPKDASSVDKKIFFFCILFAWPIVLLCMVLILMASVGYVIAERVVSWWR